MQFPRSDGKWIGRLELLTMRRTVIKMSGRAILLAWIFSVAALAANVTGIWDFSIIWASGESGVPIFDLKQEGKKVTGKYTGGLGYADVSGVVEGKQVTLELQTKAGVMRVTGKLDDSSRKITGEAEYPVGATSPGRGTFTANRRSTQDSGFPADHLSAFQVVQQKYVVHGLYVHSTSESSTYSQAVAQ
jgi:hypothetical protein